MKNITFKNGSSMDIIETEESDKVIRGKRALISPYDDRDIAIEWYLQNEYDWDGSDD